MKISIIAIGRLRKSPEKELIDDYLSRFSKLAKPFGLSLNPIIEIEDKKGGGPKTEAQLLEKHFHLGFTLTLTVQVALPVLDGLMELVQVMLKVRPFQCLAHTELIQVLIRIFLA